MGFVKIIFKLLNYYFMENEISIKMTDIKPLDLINNDKIPEISCVGSEFEDKEITINQNNTTGIIKKNKEMITKANVGCIRIWYFLLNGLILLSICYFNDEILTRIGWILMLLYLVVTFIASYLFLTVRNNPGVVIDDANNNNFSKTSASYDLINSSILTEDNETEKAFENFTSDEANLKNNEYVKELKIKMIKYCKKCDHYIVNHHLYNKNKPLRGKHCSTCGVCVKLYDHHCFFTMGCIGQNNHFSFLIYLSIEMIHIVLAFYGV